MDDLQFTEAKTKLKNYSQDNGYEKPAYEVVSKRLEDVRKIYKVRVTVEGLVETIGEGYSRRLAEHRAAINALKEISEVREEQRKTKEEEKTSKELDESSSDLNNTNDSKTTNPSDDDRETNDQKLSDKQVNGDHNDQEMTTNDNNQSNSIIISADINTSAEEESKTNGVVANGHNSDDQSTSSSDNGPNNDINGKNDSNSGEDNDNSVSNDDKINGKTEKKPSVRSFPPLTKTSMQKLQDFCMSQQSPFPFYDSTYKDDSFRIKCRIEFTVDNEKREFFGTGFGDTMKVAKLGAADDIIQQLTEHKFI